jgi:hypothetical protein
MTELYSHVNVRSGRHWFSPASSNSLSRLVFHKNKAINATLNCAFQASDILEILVDALEKLPSEATCQANGGWFNPTTSHPREGISAINQPVEPVTFQSIIHANFKDIPHCGPEHFERLDTAGCRRTLHLTRSVALLIGDADTSMG